jgi:hypothetical protein
VALRKGLLKDSDDGRFQFRQRIILFHCRLLSLRSGGMQQAEAGVDKP